MCNPSHNQTIYGQIIAVTNRHLCSRPLPLQVERVCRCHPKAVILREKDLDEESYLVLAKEIMGICASFQVPCILHTYVNAALRLSCPYIHIPLPLLREYERTKLPFLQIGTSIHSPEEAEEAWKLGATYLTAGHIYATGCKPGLPPRGLPFLKGVCGRVPVPVYAIGGIKADAGQLKEIAAQGAAGGCVMSGMMEL